MVDVEGMQMLRRLAAAGALARVLLEAPASAGQTLPEPDRAAPDRLDRHTQEREPATSDLWVATTAQARLHPEGHSFGAGIVLGAALDAWAAPRAAGAPADPEAGGEVGPSVRVDAELARGAVRAALARARVVEAEGRLDGLADRSRSSAVLPELRLRAMRVIDEDQALSPTAYDPSRITASGGSSTWLEARATWKLDRLVFAREEIAVERLRTGQARVVRTIEHDVLDALARWHRARWRSLDPEAPAELRFEADLEAAAIEASLDVWTDGWLSRELARRARR